jgi:hypothetical protein
MKKLLVIVSVLFSSLVVNAQNDNYNNVITLYGGINSISRIQSSMFYDADWKDYPYGYNKSSSPTFGIDWDYGLGDRISLGVYFNYAQTKSEKIHPNPEYYYPTFSSKAFGFGARTLFHFFKEQNKGDLYLGLGLGIVGWGHEMTPQDIYFLVAKQSVLNVQIPLSIGYRYYFTERLAGTAEFSTSFMNKAKIGLSYRFSAL